MKTGYALVLACSFSLIGSSSVGEARTTRRAEPKSAAAPARQKPAAPAQAIETGDPDLPLIGRGIDKTLYLALRQAMIDRLRGFPLRQPTAYNPRVKAIQMLEKDGREIRFHGLSRAVQPLISATTWTSIGPAPIPNGQTEGGASLPVSGRVSSIAVHPTNPDIAYVGTANGGVYRTLDGGNTWTALLDNALSLAVGAIAIAPSNPSTVFVGTGEGNSTCNTYSGVGVYRITNADTAPTVTGPFNSDGAGKDVLSWSGISRILVDPLDANTIFVSTVGVETTLDCNWLYGASRGIYRSTNALAAAPTFAKIQVTTADAGDRAVMDMVLDPGDPNHLICISYGTSAAGDGGIFRTTNALAATPAFTQVKGLGTGTDYIVGHLAINKVGSVVTVVAATSEAGTGACSTAKENGQVRVSTDGGATWSAPLPAANGFCADQCDYDATPAIDPTNAQNLYIGGSANSTCSRMLGKSTDGGTTFNASDTGLHADVHAIVFAPSNPSIIYCGNDGGIFRSVNGGTTWASLNTAGFSATQFQSLALHPTDTSFFIGGTQDNGTICHGTCGTNTDPAAWHRGDYGDGGFALIDSNSTDTATVRMYHTYYNLTNNFIGFASVTRSADAFDANWTFYGCGDPATTVANGIRCADSVAFYAPMALGPGNPNTVYFGTDRLYRSANSGVNMTVVSQAPIVSGGAFISAIAISPQDDNVRVVGTSNGKIFATTTGSKPMTNITPAGFPAYYVSQVVIDPNDGTTFYVTLAGYGLSAGTHIWKVTGLGSATPIWSNLAGFSRDIPVESFVVDPTNSSWLYAGHDAGISRSRDGGSTWSDFGGGLPLVPVFAIGLQPVKRAMRIGTYGRGVWERTVCQRITVNAATVPNGTFAAAYNQALSAAGAIGTTTFSSTGTLPPGLVLSAAGALTGAPLAVGTYNFTAIASDANGCTGTRAYALTIGPAATTTTLVSSSNPSKSGATVTFTATVTAGATGSVVFSDGATALTTVPLTASTASYSTAALSTGSHAITAAYGGDANYAASTSAVLSQVVGGVHGDANNDGQVTAADIFYLINYLFGTGAAPAGPADVNGDTQVTAADIFYLINYLFAGGAAPV